ncbi:pyridoxamine 5'-phosphate oxidase, FMN-binding family [Variovorax sp. PBS-H4]|uniref:pyridoxamine 5'-phosphate oxidase family protein n=1 Tax=Variovorax sp. PBS-H4 TaxID=434008 RepID=UPI001318675D|nr:pyridoxamine 5'-phosphate oxidase family protein [Variovorax sp. PBS-H4]VTU21229.1 pyridoxamine 5'-phosphate oxidase, FMN-binding family [Variovorax sp. PBS-H4]
MTALAWHEGERVLQARAGIAHRMAEIGPRVLRDHMPEQHRTFFAQLPFLIAGSLDSAGQPWASVLAAAPGFAHSPDPRHLRIDALPQANDPLATALAVGAPIGLLGIEPQTRRRNRMNGTVDALDARGFSVEVGQSFGNCPKYIQAREPVFVGGAAAPGFGPRMHGLDAQARRMVRAADTFFIATAHPSAGDARSPAEGVDVSHRGGRPGFVRFEGEGTLTVPDFTGNAFFNTLGNIALNPKAGLLFVDFATGDLLQLTVSATILWEGPEVYAFAGAERLLRMEVLTAQRAPAALPLRFGPASLSPFLEATGRWPEER